MSDQDKHKGQLIYDIIQAAESAAILENRESELNKTDLFFQLAYLSTEQLEQIQKKATES
jgi:hypothetical protein